MPVKELVNVMCCLFHLLKRFILFLTSAAHRDVTNRAMAEQLEGQGVQALGLRGQGDKMSNTSKPTGESHGFPASTSTSA